MHYINASMFIVLHCIAVLMEKIYLHMACVFLGRFHTHPLRDEIERKMLNVVNIVDTGIRKRDTTETYTVFLQQKKYG